MSNRAENRDVRRLAAAYVVDTNVYVRAFREPAFSTAFNRWHEAMVGRLAMSAVVLHELLVGAIDDRRRLLLERTYAAEFRRRGRLLAPSTAAWSKAASADRRLRAERRYREKLDRRSFSNDLLIAQSCREVGATLITENSADFEIIRRVTGVRFVTELP